VRFHVEEETRRLTSQGVPSAEARRRALAAFGGLEPMKEYTRRAPDRLGRGSDQRRPYAGRMMRRNSGFTLAAILSLAIGIGANAAIFSITDALMLGRFPSSARKSCRSSIAPGSNRESALLASDFT
jgi:hypothetical protein